MDQAAARALLGSHFPCAVTDRDGIITAINPAAARLLPSAWIGQYLAPMLGLDFAQMLIGAAEPFPKPVPGLAKDEDGTLLALLAHPLPTVCGGLVVGFTDLSAAREAEQHRFKKTPYGNLRLDSERRVRYANNAAERLFGKSCVGRDFADLFEFTVGEQVRHAFDLVVRNENAQSVSVSSGFQTVVGSRSFPSEPLLTLLPEYAPGGRITGVLATVREQIVDALRLQLREAAAAEGPADFDEWADRMRALLDVLKLAVPFDRAYLTRFSADGTWTRPVLVHPGEPWPSAWAPVPRGIWDRLLQRRPFVFEIGEAVTFDPDNAHSPLIERHVADGMVSHVMLPLPFDQPVAALTLASREPNLFCKHGCQEQTADACWTASNDEWPLSPFKALLALQLEPLLVTMLRRLEQHEARIQRLGDTVGGAKTVPEATRTLLRGLLKHFGWDHATIYVVERGPEAMELRPFVQYPDTDGDGRPHPLTVPWSYRQPLYDPAPGKVFDHMQARESGMMGAVIRNARRRDGPGFLVAQDVKDPSTHGKAPHWFRRVSQEEASAGEASAGEASALTVAISIDDRVRWVLDTVSRHPNAFIEEDGARVAELVRKLADRVAALRTAALNETLIELVEQGVVVTDRAGTILRANRRAQGILGLPAGRQAEGVRLHDHLCPDANGTVMSLPARERLRTNVRLGPIGGEGHDVWAERFEDSTETRDLVWLLDAKEREAFTHDARYIQATVQEVARQARGPLLLASMLAKRIVSGDQPPFGQMVRQLRAEIGKADITFERLAETADVRRAPKRDETEVRLNELVTDIVAGRCCTDWLRGAGDLAGVAGSSLSDPGCHLALQAKCRPSPPHPQAEVQGHELARL